MSKSLSIITEGRFAFYTVREHGIEFDQNAPKSCWLEVFERLSNLHYSVIAGIEDQKEQDDFIQEALKEKLTVNQLKDHVAETHPMTKRGVKRSRATSVATKETEATALKKLTESGEFTSTLDINNLGEEWKEPAGIWYRIYRRNWCGKGKK